MRAFLDVDGPLADFVTAAKEALCCDGLISAGQVFEEDTDWDFWKPFGISNTVFWDCIHRRGPSFWSDLNRTSWACELVEYVKSIDENFSFLTSPSSHPCSYAGKAQWLKRFFPKHKIILCNDKKLLSGRNRILIDDSIQNCVEWEGAGGWAVLFPTCCNKSEGFHLWAKSGPVGDVVDNVRRIAGCTQ